MRNTLEYPITKDEMIMVIQGQIDQIYEDYKVNGFPCGDIRPDALQEAINFIRENYTNGKDS